MIDRDVVDVYKEGFEVLCMWARNIALLPLEDWKRSLELAEATAPVLHPTLYREYLYSEKAQFIKHLIEAAIPLQKLVLEVQQTQLKEMPCSNVKN